MIIRVRPFVSQISASAMCVIALTACGPTESSSDLNSSNSDTPTDSPNILIVLLDDVGVDMVGAYGAAPETVRTPNIDAFASTGLLFRSAWATPLCTPTRAAIQTGRYPFRTGVGTVGNGGLASEEVTLAEMLKLGTNGRYTTAAIGKWHLASTENGGAKSPNLAGYDHFAGTLGNLPDYFNYKKVVNGEMHDVKSYASSDQASDALEWIEAANEPWFCYLAFNAAHRPLHTPPPRLVRSKTKHSDPGMAAFAAMVEALDTEVGRLLNGIPTDVRARTNIALLSDNGTHRTQSAEPGKATEGKGSVHESGIRIPFIVAGPNVRKFGSESNALIDITDLFATVADWARVDLTHLQSSLAGQLDSVSLARYLDEENVEPPRQTAFSECFRPNGLGPYTMMRRAIRDERYKLVHLEKAGRDTFEHLYDLQLDPDEKRDLLKHEPNADRTQNTYKLLSERMQSLVQK